MVTKTTSCRPSFLRSTRGARKVKLCKLIEKKEERLGRGEEKGRPADLNYRLGEKEIPIGRLLVNLSTTKTSPSQRSPVFTAASTAAHGKNRHGGLKGSLWTAYLQLLLCETCDYILGQKPIFLASSKCPYVTIKGQFQIVCPPTMIVLGRWGRSFKFRLRSAQSISQYASLEELSLGEFDPLKI